jgi:hypothetical protein
MPSDDFTAHSMRLRFDAKLRVTSQKGAFPSDTIAAVYVTNRDGCSHHEATVAKDGTMSVDYDMRALKEGVRLTDRVKFHFFFRDNADKLLKPISAGHIGLEDLASRVRTGHSCLKVQCNFNSNSVEMRFVRNEEQSKQMQVDLLRLGNVGALAPSVLGKDTEMFVNKLRRVDESVKEGLDQHTFVTTDNGGTMFQSLFTAHTMQNEATLYTLYHHDFDGPENVPPWLCTYMLADTLHHNAVTPEQVKAMQPENLTAFIGSYAQAPMRSATAAPYTDDLILSEDPKMAGTRRCTMLSEVFKRPFSHPYHLLQGQFHGCLIDDDCEGLAALMRDMTNHLGLMYTQHREELQPIIAARGRGSSSSLGGNHLMKAYFPADLFSEMPVSYQARLVDMALHLGEHIASRKIECHITLASAMGASFGAEAGKREIQAHACASLVCNIPGHAAAMMLEGTACMVDDHLNANGKKIKIAGKYVPIVDVANSLNRVLQNDTPAGKKLKCKTAMHVTHEKGSFYRTAFCQNGTMLASQIGSAPIQFGIDMEYLSDNGIKVHLPVTGKVLGEGEYAKLEEYVKARRDEIHTPLVDHDLIRSKLNWVPMTPFNGCDKLQPGRPFLTCMVHVASDESTSTKELMECAQKEVEDFNSKPEHSSHLGIMRAVATMDGVSKLFHFYSDDLSYLQKSIVVEDDSSAQQSVVG